jgi:UDP-GlcNAc3NAcA epimerase
MYLTVNYFKEKSLEVDNNFSDYYFATIHRPSNTDSKEQLKSIFDLFNSLNKKVVIPLHPRTKSKLNEFSIKISENIKIIEPC